MYMYRMSIKGMVKDTLFNIGCRSYGGWSFALESYYELNLTTYFNDPKMQQMMNIIDAFEYRDKLLMPKYVINGGNDEFFLPTDTRYWWEQMPNHQKLNRFLMLPNTDHGIIGGLFGKTILMKMPP